MKKLWFASLLSVITATAFGQADTSKVTSNYQAGWGDLNYGVPESPAFKILGTSPSDIMRPGSVKNISVSVGSYFLNNGATIPQNLAVEVSPSVFKPNVNLTDFNASRLWYTSAFSVGTKVNADKSYAIGVGYKIRLLDNEDLRTDHIHLKQLDLMGEKEADAYSEVIQAVAMHHSQTDAKKQSYEEWRVKVTTAYQKPVTDSDKMLRTEVSNALNKQFDTSKISAFRDSLKKANWNKTIWDLGVAALFNSKDSLLRDIQPASKLGFWTTAGLPVFGQKGQVLLGINGGVRDSVTTKLNILTLNLGSRIYYGSNDLKGFIECNYMIQTAVDGTLKASVGIEATFVGGMWLDFRLGLSKQGGEKTVFTPGFNILFGNSEKKTKGT